jgi:hypothetical protein
MKYLQPGDLGVPHLGIGSSIQKCTYPTLKTTLLASMSGLEIALGSWAENTG